jgi:putative peptide modification system cyclase
MHAPADSSPVTAPQLRCLVVSDLAASTALIDRLGDARAAALIREHDRVARQAMQDHHGQEIDKTDGFLILFERPIDALAFSLDYQAGLRALREREEIALLARIGIHVGEVLTWRNSEAAVAGGAKPVEVEGLAKVIAARLMSLADPGQILLTESAYSLALRACAELPQWELKWAEHGRYELHGVAQPMSVFQVGADRAALQAPRNKSKARRQRPPLPKGLFALLALLLLAWPIWKLLTPSPAIAFVERDWLVVGDVRNLTGDAMFDDSLASAIRIGLEQSRHINLVGLLKAQQTLALMQSEGAAIDREVGSELAARAGARALLLPSLAEVGGRLRFTAELVDPQTGTTVYSDSEEAAGSDQVISAVGSVLGRVRGNLGESLSLLAKADEPLPMLTTGNLEALRAYALGNKAYVADDRDGARRLFDEALRLDPEFDLARIGLARLSMAFGDTAAALAHLRQIDPERGRLSTRERLYYESLRAWCESSLPEVLAKWKQLWTLYPDHHGAYANYALVASQWGNLFEESLENARRAVSPQNGMLVSTYDIIAEMHLALDQLDAADAALRKARELGSAGSRMVYLMVAAARNDWTQVDAAAKLMTEPARDAYEFYRQIIRVALAFDRGRWNEADSVLSAALGRADRHGVGVDRTFRLVQLSLAAEGLVAWEGELDVDAALARLLGELLADLPRDHAAAWFQQAAPALMLAAIIARRGNSDLTLETLATLEDDVEADGFPLVRSLRAAANAELALRGDDADAAIGGLRQAMDGREMLLLHVIELRALQAAGRHDEALAKARWWQQRRSRAYAEFNLNRALTPLYVATTRLAPLTEAESLLALQQREQAAEVLRRWIEREAGATLPPVIAARVVALQETLQPAAVAR